MKNVVLVKTADTLEGLAKEIGVPAENFKKQLQKLGTKLLLIKKDSEFGRSTAMDHDFNNWSIPRNPNRTWYSPHNGWFENNTNAQVLKRRRFSYQWIIRCW